jgi:hypothetical protein
MALQDSDALRNARATAIETTIGASPTMEVRSGLPPANAAASDTGTLLASITLPADWLGAASGGAVAQVGSWAATASASGLAGHFRIKAGATTHRQGLLSQAWTAATAFLVGQHVHNGGNVYRCTTAGTSAGAGGPSGTGGSIADNTAVWAYVGPGPDLTLDNTNIASGQNVTFSSVQFTEGNA